MTRPTECRGEKKEKMDGEKDREWVTEKNIQLLWKHEGGRRVEKGTIWRERERRTNRGERSTHQGDMKELERKEERKGEEIWLPRKQQEKTPAGEKETKCVEETKQRKSMGEEREWEDWKRQREERIEWMLTGSPNQELRLYPSQAEEQQSQTHFLSPWP